MTEQTCCICMEESKAIKHVAYMFVCPTCESGFVCNKCINGFDPMGSIFGKMWYIKKTIKCPCCRQLNWKQHYNQIVQVTLNNDLLDYEDDDYNPAIKLYLKNFSLVK